MLIKLVVSSEALVSVSSDWLVPCVIIGLRVPKDGLVLLLIPTEAAGAPRSFEPHDLVPEILMSEYGIQHGFDVVACGRVAMPIKSAIVPENAMHFERANSEKRDERRHGLAPNSIVDID